MCKSNTLSTVCILFCLLSAVCGSALNRTKWNETNGWNETNLEVDVAIAACIDIAENHGFKQVALFTDLERVKQDCCLMQFEGNCAKWFCANHSKAKRNTSEWTLSAVNTLDEAVCEHYETRLQAYHDNVFVCNQLKAADGQPIACDLLHVRNRDASEADSSGGGGMPIWLIVLLVILIILGIVMLIIVVRLFTADPGPKKKDKGTSHRKASAGGSRHKEKVSKASSRPKRKASRKKTG